MITFTKSITVGLVIAVTTINHINAAALPNGYYETNCPPKDFDSVQDFNLTAYLGHWYCQAQSPVTYAPISENYCVTATYSLKDNGDILVHNYDNKNQPNGPSRSVNLNGRIPDPDDSSKIKVGFPGFELLAGNYWVVYVGPIDEDTGLYSTALISGGSPSYENMDNGLCIAPNNAGFWVFTRDQLPDDGVVDGLKEIGRGLGLDVDALNPIVQDGCDYENEY
ncbi:hypothetical protein HDU76_008259 [Blyttiomyces sp. JEL0837]|nr:hypothetical protein HDU76_008259 [Blyttiomyces sp. JEL0837]